MDNKFKKGFFLGSLLALAAAIGFAKSKKGQETFEKIKEKMGPMMDKMKEHHKSCCSHDCEDDTKENPV